MEYQKIFNHGKTITLFTLTLMFAITVTPVFASHCKGKHANDPGCDSGGGGGGGGGTPPTPVNLDAWWLPGGISAAFPQTLADDEEPRFCNPEQFLADGTYGPYHCQHVQGVFDGLTSFDFSGVTREQTRKRGDEQLCSAMDGISLHADSQYNFYWQGDCKSASGCEVVILNWFYGQDVADAVAANAGAGAKRADLVKLTGYASLPQIGSGEDSNPFFVARVMDVHTVTVEFSGEGSNKTVATCEYDTGGSAIPAIFETAPLP